MKEMPSRDQKEKVAKYVYYLSPDHWSCPSPGGNAEVTDCRSEEPSLQRESSNTYLCLAREVEVVVGKRA